jgi:hypothetical protein
LSSSARNIVVKMNKAWDEVCVAESGKMAQEGYRPLLKKSRCCVPKRGFRRLRFGSAGLSGAVRRQMLRRLAIRAGRSGNPPTGLALNQADADHAVFRFANAILRHHVQ